MLIFAKDITERDHQHAREADNAALREYMEYQRKLFPYTVIRAGLDLAYKELDDVLNYVDNEYQKPEGAMRDEYPADIPEWYRQQFPWAGSFMEMEDMHALMVLLIKAMDSFRTYEKANTYHWTVLYDTTRNIVRVYNELLNTDAERARDIQLSQAVAVDFEDFVNNYWPHLEFMILSKPDYAHTRLMERVRQAEETLKQRMAEGEAPLVALEKAGKQFALEPATLPLLRRDPIPPDRAALESRPLKDNPFAALSQCIAEDDDSPFAGLSRIDAEYEINFNLSRSQTPAS
jgi:hypothetical protein